MDDRKAECGLWHPLCCLIQIRQGFLFTFYCLNIRWIYSQSFVIVNNSQFIVSDFIKKIFSVVGLKKIVFLSTGSSRGSRATYSFITCLKELIEPAGWCREPILYRWQAVWADSPLRSCRKVPLTVVAHVVGRLFLLCLVWPLQVKNMKPTTKLARKRNIDMKIKVKYDCRASKLIFQYLEWKL